MGKWYPVAKTVDKEGVTYPTTTGTPGASPCTAILEIVWNAWELCPLKGQGNYIPTSRVVTVKAAWREGTKGLLYFFLLKSFYFFKFSGTEMKILAVRYSGTGPGHQRLKWVCLAGSTVYILSHIWLGGEATHDSMERGLFKAPCLDPSQTVPYLCLLSADFTISFHYNKTIIITIMLSWVVVLVNDWPRG